MLDNKNKFILLFIFSILFIILSSNLYADKLDNFNININITSPKSAHIVESLYIPFTSESDISNFKNKITEAGADIKKLQKINVILKPHIYLNDYNNLSVSFDEINKKVRIEYDIYDLCLIKYLENDKEILWKLNENLFRFFILNNLYYIPKDSYMSVSLYDGVMIQTTVPKCDVVKNKITWTGISSNELRLLAIEKKPPKASFVFSNLFDYKNIKTSLIYLFSLLILIIILLFFIKKMSKHIKSFVIKHSQITPKEQKKDVIFDYKFFKK